MIESRLFYAVCLACILGCSREQPAKPVASTRTAAIALATTTSTQDSGLLDELLAAFESESGITVKVVAIGSGQALELARRGDADVLLVHSPAAEKEFMDQGFGDKRLAVMHNDYVIVGPPDDPAKTKTAPNAADALTAIAKVQTPFISRGDDSGTHKKELELWKATSVTPKNDWYISAGAGMAQTLRIANEKKAYVLADRGTYLALKGELELVVLFEGDERLLNRYSVITINPDKHPHLHHDEANRFAEYLISPAGQEAIGAFGVERFGQALFIPDASQ
jgi:tungstate transport system substrate-binding protein